MGKLIAVLAIVLSGSVFAYLYYQLETAPLDAVPATPVNAINDRTVKVVHAFKDGVHRYSGSFKLPHSCYEVVKDAVIDPSDPDRSDVLLRFRTKDRSAEISPCAQYTTSYPFELILETDEDAAIRAEIDGKPMQIQIIESTWSSPKGTTVVGDPL